MGRKWEGVAFRKPVCAHTISRLFFAPEQFFFRSLKKVKTSKVNEHLVMQWRVSMSIWWDDFGHSLLVWAGKEVHSSNGTFHSFFFFCSMRQGSITSSFGLLAH